jgi:hypothetical protein
MILPKHPHRTVDGAMSEGILETEIEGAMALKNLTPLKLRCGLAQCPAIYEEIGGSHLQIIGEVVEGSEVEARIGPGEALIRVEKALLANVGGPISRIMMRLGL